MVRSDGRSQLAGQVHVFSSSHPSGQQLLHMTGVAAVLRYRLPDLDDVREALAAHDEAGRAWEHDSTDDEGDRAPGRCWRGFRALGDDV